MTDDPGIPEDLAADEPPETPSHSRPPVVAPPPPWVGLVTVLGLALSVIAALDVLFIVAQGLSLPAQVGPFLRIGFAFGTTFNKDALGWIALLGAIFLVASPAIVGARTSHSQDRAAALAIALATAFAVVIAVGAILGVVANHKLYDLAGRELTPSVRRELFMFAFRRVATSGVVLFAGIYAIRIRLGNAPTQ